jgi:hypothetical protein
VPSDRYQAQFAAAKMKDLGLKNVVVAYSDGSYGQSLAFSFIAYFTKAGGKAVPVPTPLGSSDVTKTLEAIKKHAPDGVFLATNEIGFAAGAQGAGGGGAGAGAPRARGMTPPRRVPPIHAPTSHPSVPRPPSRRPSRRPIPTPAPIPPSIPPPLPQTSSRPSRRRASRSPSSTATP